MFRERFLRMILLTSLFFICALSVQAQTLINNCTGSYNINAGGHYVLNNSIANNGTCINILVNDVLLDCQGFNMTGNGTLFGVNAGVGLNNVTVQNCEIYNFSSGISFTIVTGSTIFNNTIMRNMQAIWFQWGSDNNNITTNILNNNSRYGFLVASVAQSVNNTITGNTANFNGRDGFNFNQSSNNTVINNIANYNTRFGFYIVNQSNNNTFTGNTANNNSEGFVIWSNSTGNIFNSNRAINNSVFGIDFPGLSCPFNTFISNVLSNPAGWDLHLDSPNLSFYNATLGAEYSPVGISFTDYNGTMRMTGVQNSPADPPGLVNIAKYLNISKLVNTYLVLNISYSDADIVNVQENTLRMLRFTGAWVGTNSTVYAAQNFVSARLTNYSSFGLFGQQQPQPPVVAGGGGGGSATRFYESSIVSENLDVEKKMTKDLRRLRAVKFVCKKEVHQITLLNVDMVNQQVALQVESTPRQYILGLNQTILVDIDGNSYDDLSIHVDRIESGAAILTVEKIQEVIPVTAPPVLPEQETEGVEELEPVKDVAPEPVVQDFAGPEPVWVPEPVKKRGNWDVLIVVLVILIVAWLIHRATKKQKKKHH